MNAQLLLFDDEQYDITDKLRNLRISVRLGWTPFSVDKLQKCSIVYGITCEQVLNTYEKVISNEQLSDNTKNKKCPESS
jgi:hypothetical protein